MAIEDDLNERGYAMVWESAWARLILNSGLSYETTDCEGARWFDVIAIAVRRVRGDLGLAVLQRIVRDVPERDALLTVIEAAGPPKPYDEDADETPPDGPVEVYLKSRSW